MVNVIKVILLIIASIMVLFFARIVDIYCALEEKKINRNDDDFEVSDNKENKNG